MLAGWCGSRHRSGLVVTHLREGVESKSVDQASMSGPSQAGHQSSGPRAVRNRCAEPVRDSCRLVCGERWC